MARALQAVYDVGIRDEVLEEWITKASDAGERILRRLCGPEDAFSLYLDGFEDCISVWPGR